MKHEALYDLIHTMFIYSEGEERRQWKAILIKVKAHESLNQEETKMCNDAISYF